jgi:hypothetical protein
MPKTQVTVRIRTDIREALEELRHKRSKQFEDVSLADVLTEAAVLLLQKEGMLSAEPEPRRKPARAIRTRKVAAA